MFDFAVVSQFRLPISKQDAKNPSSFCCSQLLFDCDWLDGAMTHLLIHTVDTVSVCGKWERGETGRGEWVLYSRGGECGKWCVCG